MKKLIVLIVLAAAVLACGNQQKQTATAEGEIVVLTVDQLMASAPELVDQEILLAGLVTHVCKHGGQRCFVMGSTDEVSIRIEAGDEIEAFKQEHVGDVLQITGILRLVPVDGGHVCSEEEAAAKANDTAMNSEMASDSVANEEYVPIYYIDGLKFIVLTEGPESADATVGEV